jgi:hypothetical protein
MAQNGEKLSGPPADWSSNLLIDILSHHLYKSYLRDTDALACRLVCQTWCSAFSISSLKIKTGDIDKDWNISQNMVGKARALYFTSPTAVDLRHFVRLSRDARYVQLLELKFVTLTKEESVAVSNLFRLSLPSLEQFTLFCADPHLSSTSSVICRGITDMKLLITHLNLSSSNLGDEEGSEIILALRQNKTIKTLSLDYCSLASESLRSLAILLEENKFLTELSLARNRDLFSEESSSTAFGAALASNTTLQSLSIDFCSPCHASSVFSALRVNRTLKSLQAAYLSFAGSQLL